MIKYQTLHAHTTTSDGKFGYLELLDLCGKNNIEVIAFTDHDSLPSEKFQNALGKNKNHETKWIFGIEISSGWPKDLGGGATSGLHLVGLFVDPRNKKLTEHCKLAKEARIVRMKKMVKNLQGLGFSLTVEDCLKASGDESVGRPHIVEAIKTHPENLGVYNKLIAKLKVDSEKDKQLADKYKYLMERGDEQYAYVLFLSEDSFIPGVYVDYQYYSDFDRSVKLIRNSGGAAILAHWMSCRFKMGEKYLEQLFLSNRLDGAEVTYGLSDYNTSEWNERVNEMEVIRKIVNRAKKLRSGGCDAHDLKDLVDFNRNSWYAKRTQGMAEKIISASKVDIQYSSFK